MKNRRTMIAFAALLVATAASAQTRERQQEALDAYMPYVGESVDRFQFWDLKQWELVAPDKVVVWPRLNQAFLITVDEPCIELEWAKSIALTSSANTVSARFDSVKAGGDTCRINLIQPIDYKKYRADRSAAKLEDGKP